MKLLDSWGEVSAGIVLLIGLIISLVVDSAIVSYAVILCCGIIIGRYYRLKKSLRSMVFYFVSFGFLLGYILGAFINRRGNPLLILLFFAIGCYYGDYWVKKRIIR